MRLFVSVDLDGLGEGVAEAQAPFADLPGLNPTDPESAHVTMKFLGDGPDAGHDLDALSAAIETAVETADVGPFDARFEGLGVFPSLEYISVVWLGVENGRAELTALHEALEAETTALGYDAESHEFTPHVTLARMDHAAAKETVQKAVEETYPEAGTLHVEELRLTESTLTPEGPEYETLERFPL
ncbi:RNA 2',3'-cyclic phosphodiesterase [Natronomonas sp. CBA1123]|uniref:RNA 2',3'-cyclic phosphodiesterase n=1 Tax=Natronomonas sp. CBA1123 TaxID=2668070 RepID=UPI0012EA54E6|nr:RNA 2',3'-cyclic phosphodiesterase [Natronomonas sp. CBA1123]MUV87505.1 RNA 2',3'-cyclic phosphodiesterase [Natronomonas sp. CBA1123]